MISIYVLVVSAICTVLGYFSRTPDMLMGGVLSERKGKICSIIQGLFNWSVCLIMLFYVIKGYFYDTVLQVAFLFGIQLFVQMEFISKLIKKNNWQNSLPILIEKAPEIIWKLTLALIKAVPKLLKAAVEIIATLITGLADNLFKLINWCLELPGKIVQAIRDGIQQIKNVGGECMSGLVDGLKDKWEKLKGGVQNLGNGIVNKFKSIFGIHSPSKEFAFIGKMNMEGLNKGMEDMQPEIQKTIDGAFNLNPSLTNNASTHYSPTLNVVVNNDMAFDPLGQLVSNIKTFSGGAKNDYNYGVGR